MVQAAIYGCEGLTLTDAEKQFFAAADPWGFILFARNIDTPAQVSAMCSDLRMTVGRDAPILVDQEGGRVARFRPPHWRAYPPARRYGELFAKDKAAGLEACRLGAFLIGAELRDMGLDVDCIPLADVPVALTTDLIAETIRARHPDRHIHLMLENEANQASWLAEEDG